MASRRLGSRCLFACAMGGLVAAASSLAPSGALAALDGLTRVATGLSAPIFVTHAPGDRQRLFIVERGGAIRILNLATQTLEATPFLSIPSVDTESEGGLLGLAFHPDYQTNGKFYVNVTLDNGGLVYKNAVSPFSTHIRQYTVSTNANVANPTPTPVLNFIQPQSNHNGGWIGFSPRDGYLYIMSGDGGGGGDAGDGHTPGTGNAQDITGGNLLGKALRIDVDGDQFADPNRNYRIPGFQTATTNPFAPKPDPANPGEFIDHPGDDEIWAHGLRNPFRASFDRATHDLWIGDVGQASREEIDFQPANFVGGANYGWRLREGTLGGGSPPPGYVGPVYDYDRDSDSFGGTVVTGGYVYRGPDPTLQGKYFFADSRNSVPTADDNYWTFDPANPYGTVANIDSQLAPDLGSAQFPVSFGEDADGNLYIAYIASGEVYRINTNQFTAGDFNGDAMVDEADLADWQTNFGTTSGATRAHGDANADGDVDGADFLAWQRNLGWSALNPPPGPRGAAVPEPLSCVLLATGAAVFFIGRARRAI